jgi:predicted nucleic acid-binding Zn ribbon protein
MCTYTPYATAANTATTIRGFIEFMIVLLDESLRLRFLSGNGRKEKMEPKEKVMSGDGLWFEETGDEFQDNEFPNHDSDDEPTQTAPCPQCGADIYEDAVQCSACGTYITQETNVWSGRPPWWIILGLLGILAVVLALAGFSAW